MKIKPTLMFWIRYEIPTAYENLSENMAEKSP